MTGNTADCTTPKQFLTQIEATYGKARGVWVMDRGIPTEALLAEMRDPARGVFYLVGTPKSPLCGEDLFLTSLNRNDLLVCRGINCESQAKAR